MGLKADNNMKRTNGQYREEEHRLHEEFLIELSRGCKALKEAQRCLSNRLGFHVHLADMAEAYDGRYGTTSPEHDRADILDRIKAAFLENPGYISLIDQASRAVRHSNSIYGHD